MNTEEKNKNGGGITPWDVAIAMMYARNPGLFVALSILPGLLLLALAPFIGAIGAALWLASFPVAWIENLLEKRKGARRPQKPQAPPAPPTLTRGSGTKTSKPPSPKPPERPAIELPPQETWAVKKYFDEAEKTSGNGGASAEAEFLYLLSATEAWKRVIGEADPERAAHYTEAAKKLRDHGRKLGLGAKRTIPPEKTLLREVLAAVPEFTRWRLRKLGGEAGAAPNPEPNEEDLLRAAAKVRVERYAFPPLWEKINGQD